MGILDAPGRTLAVNSTVSTDGTLAVNRHNPVDASASNRTMTLPDATGGGQTVIVSKKDSTSNTVTINVAHLRDNGAGTVTLDYQFESLEFLSKSDGTWWPIAGHKTKAQLSATFATVAGLQKNTRKIVGYESLVAALSEAQDDVAVGLVGDSTGDAVDEWFYLFGQYLATTNPAYTAKHRAWSDSTQKLAAPTTYQTGTGGVQRAVVMAPSGITGGVGFAGPNVITDLDVAIYCKPGTWRSGTQTFVSKFSTSGTDRSFRFQINSTGNLVFDWTADGTTIQTAANSGTTVPFADGTAGWVRVVLDVDNGTGGHAIMFYTSTDGLTWTQLGSTVTRTGTTTSVFASTYAYELGVRSGGSEPLYGARIYEVEIRDGIDGPTIAPRLATLWNRGVGTGVPTIEGAPVLTMVNGSMPGAATSYLNDPVRYKRMTPDYGQAVVFFSDSHNEQNTVGQAWITLLSSWVTNVLGRLPMAAPVLLTQNPRYSPTTFIDSHAKRRRQTIGWARQKGYSVIDTYQAFLDDGRGAALINIDGIHPTQVPNGGQAVWLNAIKAPLL